MVLPKMTCCGSNICSSCIGLHMLSVTVSWLGSSLKMVKSAFVPKLGSMFSPIYFLGLLAMALTQSSNFIPNACSLEAVVAKS